MLKQLIVLIAILAVISAAPGDIRSKLEALKAKHHERRQHNEHPHKSHEDSSDSDDSSDSNSSDSNSSDSNSSDSNSSDSNSSDSDESHGHDHKSDKGHKSGPKCKGHLSVQHGHQLVQLHASHPLIYSGIPSIPAYGQGSVIFLNSPHYSVMPIPVALAGIHQAPAPQSVPILKHGVLSLISKRHQLINCGKSHSESVDLASEPEESSSEASSTDEDLEEDEKQEALGNEAAEENHDDDHSEDSADSDDSDDSGDSGDSDDEDSGSD